MRLVRTLPQLLLVILLALTAVAAQEDDARKKLNEQLWEAARKGDAAAVRALLDKGADVNAKFRYGATALSYASDKGHTEVVRVLLERGADPNVKDTFYQSTPLSWASFNGHALIVQALLDKGAEGVDDVLAIGAQNGKAELVRIALAKGGAKPETLSSALVSAEKGKHAEIVEMLKKAGAQPPPKADFVVDAETLKSYEGAYKSERGSEVNLVVRDGKLTVMSPGGSFTLGAFDKVRFRPMEFENTTLTFNVEQGKAVSFTFKQGSNETVFKRTDAK